MPAGLGLLDGLFVRGLSLHVDRPGRASAAWATRTNAGTRMKAVLHRRYGAPEALAVGEIDVPVAGDHDVLVRVIAAGVSIGDHHMITGKPYLVRVSPFGGLPRPKYAVPGAAFSGRIAAVGAHVAGFRVGDEVFGQATHGAFAEYLAMPANLVAHKPRNLDFVEAAAVPWGTTALQALRDAGRVEAGERVLIHGASGAVGTWAVQIAKALGAQVTAVCGTRNVDLVRSLGADEVIDYSKHDVIDDAGRHDVFLDLVGNHRLADCRRVLRVGGRYVPVSAGSGDWLGPIVRMIGVQCAFLLGARRTTLFMQRLDPEDLSFMRMLVESGAARPAIGRLWSFAELGAALRHVGGGRSHGLNVVRITD